MVVLGPQQIVTRAEPFEATCRNRLEGPLGGRGIEGTYVDEMDLARAEGLAAAEDLGDIEPRLEMIEHDDERQRPRLGEHIALTLFAIAL